ncbi:bis(5'nucleosyl)-tetraphosphatase, ApaH [Ignisphaera aggregans DSM 17230]|uniref:Bis(5'nucleosyl)-tetraphosphatase, ApaH n=1 Tax=Ignisphaera aggregans (strain DSM 17230 / JCM 13409 / AQ1.S1) TaxID=583356 RepID=E0SQQ9_IGNAA|nr:bis(5'nucleosyl)-tetraphosphatase, ApaH [Ignisphaera aggregans DSM 17230]
MTGYLEESIARLRNIVDNYDEVVNTVINLRDLLIFEYNLMNRRLVHLREISRAIFVGDIHGDLDTLIELLRILDIDNELRRGTYLVFLGDYIDRGPYQLEVIMFLAILKSIWRDRIVMLRGNHEPPEWLPPSPHDFPEILMERFGYRKGLEIYETMKTIFDLLPLALYIPRKVLAVHGGPPISRVLRYDDINDIFSIENDKEAIEEILWSDPIDEDIEYVYSYRGAGKLWGRKITMLTLQKLGIELIIRGHEPSYEGYKFNHDNRVLTIFSMKGFYGNMGAACLRIDFDDKEWFKNIAKNIITI